MMFKALITSSLLVATTYAAAKPYKLIEARMPLERAFGLMGRQDAGYPPSQSLCGSGDTCAEACGPTYVQCPSNEGLSCFQPSLGQTCCPDGTGNACDEGYFCTKDTSGGTWCCPDGMDLATCAAAYSLTGSLVSETATPTSSLPPSTSAPASTTASTSSTPSQPPSSSPSSSSTPSLTPEVPPTTTSAAGAATSTAGETETTTIAPIGTGSNTAPTNGTITSLAPTQSGFVNAAAVNGVLGGLQILGLAAGALLAL
ncbi:hypothetical protein F5884DRAFT_52395 [Xylogone sp. PMI_703]|nr:hypothetical protein F5884DRAFT_52395 [Xylogone sp. PMI_703]